MTFIQGQHIPMFDSIYKLERFDISSDTFIFIDCKTGDELLITYSQFVDMRKERII